MTQTNYATLATSPTLEGINKMINKYFYSDIEIKENKNILTGNNSVFFDLYNKKGKMNYFKVLMQKNRYRFLECIDWK